MKTHGQQHIAYACTDAHIAYSVVPKYAIAHQMRHSQVLPGYPHSSASAYGSGDDFLSLLPHW